MKSKTSLLLPWLLLLTIGICFGENLNVSINVDIDKTLANYWIRTLQEAYNRFLSFFIDLANNTTALEVKAVRDFKIAATICFNTVKGKRHNTLRSLEKTVTDVKYALLRAIQSGKRAVVDRNFRKETRLYRKLSHVMEKFKDALLVTSNIIYVQKTGNGWRRRRDNTNATKDGMKIISVKMRHL